MRTATVLTILLFILGCDKEDDSTIDNCEDNIQYTATSCNLDDIIIDQEECVVSYAIQRDGDHYTRRMFVYHFDGAHYDRVDEYLAIADSVFADEPEFSTSLIYN